MAIAPLANGVCYGSDHHWLRGPLNQLTAGWQALTLTY